MRVQRLYQVAVRYRVNAPGLENRVRCRTGAVKASDVDRAMAALSDHVRRQFPGYRVEILEAWERA